MIAGGLMDWIRWLCRICRMLAWIMEEGMQIQSHGHENVVVVVYHPSI